ncbi:FecR family protein [bacterium]|nr:FecR family protein [bacterium]
MKKLFLLCVMGMALSQAVFSEEFSYKLTFIMGSVEARKGTETWRKAILNSILLPGDDLRTGPGSEAELRDADKSIIKLKENTQLTITRFDSEESVFKVLAGRIWMRMMRLKYGNMKASINTPTAVAGLRGTEFATGVWLDGTSDFFVFEGALGIREVNQTEEILLGNGFKTRVYSGQSPTAPEALTDEDLSKWQEEKPVEEKPVEEKPAPEKPKKEAKEERKSLGWQAMYGATVIDDKLYYQVGVLPELKFWKFGLGLDLSFYFDKDGNIKKDDWKVQNKILYLRYEEKEKGFYARIGALPEVTLGHGFIMNRYTNMLYYPSTKTIGIEACLNREKGRFGGFSAVLPDVDEAKLVGGRVYGKLHWFNLGATCVLDTKPATKTTVYGVDVELPLPFDIKLYGDVAKIDKYGSGFAAPGLLAKIFGADFRLEYRNMASDFIPAYFDTFYEDARMNKIASLKSQGERIKGVFSGLGYQFFKTISLAMAYEDYSNRKPSLYLGCGLNKKIGNLNSASISLYRKEAEPLFSNFKQPNTIWKLVADYQLAGPVSAVYTYKVSYDENGVAYPSLSLTTKISF